MSETTIKIEKTIAKHNMLQKGETVVAGVSGGADSMLMLSFLLNIREKLSLRIIVANVEHGIRGEESVKDSAFVENFCKENGAEFHCLRINAPALAKEAGESIEEYSRKRRYEFFKSFGADKIATAHSLSDNIETVLFRLSRGTSLNGVCGIPYVRENIIRPLLDLTSEEIRLECEKQNIPYVIDSTNSDNAYSRNYFRNVVISDIKKINPSFEKTFSRFIMSAAEDNECLDILAKECLDDCIEENALDIEKLKNYHISIIKRAVVLMLEKAQIKTDEMHINGICDFLFKSGKFQIKNDFFAISDLKTLRFDYINNSEKKFKAQRKILDSKDFLNNCELLRKEFDFCFDCDKIIGDITVRTKKDGDRISPCKRNCTKSLKKLLNEERIPADKRNGIPIVADEIGVIGVFGVCIDERVCPDKATRKFLLLKITEDKN
ncbi:MAG: tRNA lysidine(34) synthetase TilS [Eubacterium sp.]|nr:tRNA lysidine(34) synthetase TilS [Eubacterium sp.]